MAKNRKHQKRRRITAEGFTPTQNPDQAYWMRALSGAAGKHTPKPRKGTRRQRERQAVRDQIKNRKD